MVSNFILIAFVGLVHGASKGHSSLEEKYNIQQQDQSNEMASCCSEIRLDSMGFTESYQGERLGLYLITGTSEGGRPVYKQSNGNGNFLYFLTSLNLWMVGPSIGQDYGGILNREAGSCPDKLNRDWEYWNDWLEEWDSDFGFEVICSGSPGPDPTSKPTTMNPDYEACTWGAACDGCSIWHEHNGVRYCCANGCNSGGISVSTENGEVTCYCYN